MGSRVTVAEAVEEAKLRKATPALLPIIAAGIVALTKPVMVMGTSWPARL